MPLALSWLAADGPLLRPRRPLALWSLFADLTLLRVVTRRGPGLHLPSLGPHRSLVHSTLGDLGQLLVGPFLLVQCLLQ